MELNFLGRGAAFNPKEGNNSAYFIANNQLFLIDCGENIYERLIERNLLKNIDAINLMITHTHSDHVGSLGSLILHSFYELQKPVNIILPENAKHLPNIEHILESFGCEKDKYQYINEKEFDKKYEEFDNLRYIETKHCKELNCYGLIFTTKEGIIYYSGDTNEVEIIKALLSSGKKIDKIYIDTTTANYPGNVHLYIGILQETIPEELKNRIYCMHINNDDCIHQAKSLGFHVVETETPELKLSKKANKQFS